MTAIFFVVGFIAWIMAVQVAMWIAPALGITDHSPPTMITVLDAWIVGAACYCICCTPVILIWRRT